ncbi:hypothetical protein CANTEDRAFT_111550 [Yamadazyma tenuis ATCC 10573]|uniref:Peptide hydrolase n=1 Tax=Candida tenuis (strain ATCC 10573 / BCRC 21748 / CBS 615 / JCM 9827 / NBRC 10315 / NRRL Y-1498 / VKM Y-70) TaxID=590646 RepID=G3BCS8_CANTC|nr:uncharacterized protein CANTEDRAFT_111550 [Yamadazyma tenuis ATCC 10573]EGV60875.1 hypothetical protein CANTEDRAFT_111550 [Yamadazyma tenuis ATCC 10573]
MSEQGDVGNSVAQTASVASVTSAPKRSIVSVNPGQQKSKGPNFFIRFIRSVFGYRKTSLSFFVFVTFVAVYLLSYVDNSLEWSVSLPSDELESSLLDASWTDLQHIGEFKHPYGSVGNDYVHDYIEQKVKRLIKESKLPYIEYDNDLNNNNSILFKDTSGYVSYYESNNILVRINGTRDDLPALLISAHFDSVPSSYGITDDGAGIASLLGVLDYFTSEKVPQPTRTIIFNFNNNEEFGLYGAYAFLNHPWSKLVKYFINLEGTGEGGKAILFRGTDYEITKEYNAVRFPYASSIFQQAFNSRIIHSETDYKVYFETGGMRGIDIAFYKPRDIYHTGYDDISHTSKKALWHMLSSALDFVETYLEAEKPSKQFASFVSFLNFFFIVSLPKLIIFNISLLVLVPVVCFFLLLIIFGYKQNWRLGFVNSVKFPISLVFSVFVVDFAKQTMIQFFEFSPNSSATSMALTLSAVFLFSNYLILNGINFLFRNYKFIQHDEKLIVIIQISFAYWVLLIASTVRLSSNKFGNDHTGEALLTVLFVIQSAGAIFGLLGWCFKASKQDLEYELTAAGATQPLLVAQTDEYGAADHDHHTHSDNSYDWLIQFLIVAPIPLLIIYNNSWLILSGINKSIQESYKSELFIYKLIEYIGVVCVFPILPFVFKINKIIIYTVIVGAVLNCGILYASNPFNAENPMKLRFIQTANASADISESYATVVGRYGSGFEDLLKDMPSVKASGLDVNCTEPLDGLTTCSYKTPLSPKLVPGATSFSDYLSVDILKNSSSSAFGLLNGEIQINAHGSSMCSVLFDSSRTKDLPVKTVIVYNHDKTNGTVSSMATPEGFSVDKDGNFIYKDLAGLPGFKLNKLDDEKPFHIAFQWLPSLLDSDYTTSKDSLSVAIKCLWGNLGDGDSLVPAYKELNHYSPTTVSWSNLAGGMVSVSTTIEI